MFSLRLNNSTKFVFPAFLISTLLFLSSCGIRPNLIHYKDQESAPEIAQNGLIVLEWFEDGPLYSYLQLNHVPTDKTVYLQGNDEKDIQHPNKFYRPVGEYIKARLTAHRPHIYPVPAGQYTLLRIMNSEPDPKRTSTFHTSLKPLTFEVQSGQITYIGSYQIFANIGIPFIKPNVQTAITHDKSQVIAELFKDPASIVKDIPFNTQIVKIEDALPPQE